jgi:uncharacterized protein (DUF2126 family)
VPIWHDDGLIAREAADRKASSGDARVFAEGIATRLEGLIAENIDPSDPKIDGQGKWYPGESNPRWAFALRLAEQSTPICGSTMCV